MILLAALLVFAVALLVWAFFEIHRARRAARFWCGVARDHSVGALGPMAHDVGEEFVLYADLRGLWIFDGGSHIKLSQEIQNLWDTLDYPAAKYACPMTAAEIAAMHATRWDGDR